MNPAGTRAVYLDHAATTPPAPEVRDAMLPFLGNRFGNPSSVHAWGRQARAAVDEARDRLAAVLGGAHREVVFTGSGSEADNLALRGTLERWSGELGRHLVVSALEHDAVLETARRLEETGAAHLSIAECDRSGAVDPASMSALVRDDTVLVSLMLVNNETGVVQDVAAVAEAVHRRNPRTLVHTDAVQALGRLALDPLALGVDLLSLSAHKAYGPQGVGALWVRHGVFLGAQVTGGGQERGRRSGTENVAGIVGFGVAASLAEEHRPATAQTCVELAGRLRAGVAAGVPDAVVTGDDARRAPGFATFVLPGCRSDVLLTALDSRGVCASGGSACASGAPTPSHVLLAMGYPPELAACALRCTLGAGTTPDDVDIAVAAITDSVRQIRSVAQLV
jgi:cysteine desulfurase